MNVEGSYSLLQRHRIAHSMATPAVFQGGALVDSKEMETEPCVKGIPELFPTTYNVPRVALQPAAPGTKKAPMKVGIVLSGGQAPGGHNVIAGIFDYIKTVSPDSTMIGFRDGPAGVFNGVYCTIDHKMMDKYRNTGGFDMLGSGRDKIETPEQFAGSSKVCTDLNLDGLIVIGGDDSNTNAALLAEKFKSMGTKTRVIGCPKTIDGDLKNDFIPISFGFDTACRVYAEQTGNLARDALSTQKYYHFARLMGRSASHIALEVALQTRPNVCLIGEEVQTKKQSLAEIANQLTDVVEKRAAAGKHYGIILLPEGLVEFIPEIGVLIKEINDLVADKHEQTYEALLTKLTPASAAVFKFLPDAIRHQLLLDRDPHGNVQVAKIETEQLLAICIQEELTRRLKERGGKNPIPFTPLFHQFGYEGRSGLPSAFDSDYCYALGLTAAGLLSCGCTSLMASVDNLLAPVKEWKCGGVPVTMMMALERRKGKDKPVITKALVKLDGAPFNALVARRDLWALNDFYRCPGPVQFYTPDDSSHVPLTLKYEKLPKGTDPDPMPTLAQPAVYKIGDNETFLLRGDAAKCLSSLETWRQKYQPHLPTSLSRFLAGAADLHLTNMGESQTSNPRDVNQVKKTFPLTSGRVMLNITTQPTSSNPSLGSVSTKSGPRRLGIVFSGRQAPGGHNIVAGLFAAMKASKGALVGFVGGTKGLLAGTAIEITQTLVDQYMNVGGYDMLGRTVDKLDASNAARVIEVCKQHNLSGIAVVGSVKTMNNLATLAEKLKSMGSDVTVIGVPAGIDGALQGAGVECTVGFDSACHGYAQLVGNTATDAASARKYYHFLRVMGTEPSHITLEVALRTHPNIVVIGEEVGNKREGLSDIVRNIADLVSKRANAKKNFGIVLIPEGLAAAIPELKTLSDELIAVSREKGGKPTKEELMNSISPWGKALLESLPPYFRDQLLLEQSNFAMQLSQIETERLISELVEKELARRKANGTFKGKFSSVTSFLGYQARGAAPSNFDCDLGYTLGVTTAVLAMAKETSGYLAIATGLTTAAENWRVGGLPLASLMEASIGAGGHICKIPVASVPLTGAALRALREGAERWEVEEEYTNPGPCQFAGPTADSRPETLVIHDDPGYLQRLFIVQKQFDLLRNACRPGCPSALLGVATQSLRTLSDMISLINGSNLSV